jgi:hypothetical protein
MPTRTAAFHASGQGGKAKVWSTPVQIAESQGLKASDLNRILEVANEHKDKFLEAWYEFFRSVSG